MKLTHSLTLAAGFVLVGCATGNTTYLLTQKAEGPKIVALDAPRAPWVTNVTATLRQRGFKVLRQTTQHQVQQKVSNARTEVYNEAASRYVLRIDGQASMDPMQRCIGGGYNFDYINAELMDVKTNETVVTYDGSGYSENCPPLSGHIFGDIATAVEGVWK